MIAAVAVDLQIDFSEEGSLPIPNASRILPAANAVMAYVAAQRGGVVVASRDWHKSETTHFNTAGGPFPPHCVQNTEGAEFHKDVVLPAETAILTKGFHDNDDAFSAYEGYTSEFESLIDLHKRLECKDVYIFGWATDFCVKATVLDALAADYYDNVYVVSDASAGVMEHDQVLDELAIKGAKIVTSSEVYDQIVASLEV